MIDDVRGYFGVSQDFYPHLAELLVDFHALGSDPELAVTWLRDRGLGPGARVLDLGCGKGAASVAAARALGVAAVGVDGYAPFIAEAEAVAREAGVAGRCCFQVADLRATAAQAAGYDAVFFLSVGDVLGDTRQTMATLRRCVKPGGVMILDDAYSLAGRIAFPGYTQIEERAETLAALTAHGDRVLREQLISPQAMQAQNRQYYAWIEGRGRALVARHPGLAPELEKFLARQREENQLLEGRVQCATWMVERVG